MVLDLIGEVLYGKWKIRLLCFINQGNKRPSELQRKIPDAPRRAQLKELEEYGIIEKTIYPVIPPKVEYNITEFGETLLPVIKKWDDGVINIKTNCNLLLQSVSAIETVFKN